MSGGREMTCEAALQFLAAYLDRELDHATEGEVEMHLARCRSCYSRADFERRMKERVAALARSEVGPDFAERIRGLLQRFTPETPND